MITMKILQSVYGGAYPSRTLVLASLVKVQVFELNVPIATFYFF